MEWKKGKKEKRKKEKKWSVFLIEAQLEEEYVHVCLLMLQSRKKVKHAPSRECLHTQALNG